MSGYVDGSDNQYLWTYAALLDCLEEEDGWTKEGLMEANRRDANRRSDEFVTEVKGFKP